eukprot:CAMPEP_0206057676 /NCGR_PEP_ID=MMETSP1466-20131121/44861_1 /ASSEMBLY_ACC=CAM_ASM_001126 /TAXON_ID=44452 /ORGANISM="Pavlova gyrans, Strain CCMP608" /LENGTH=184 /DNA_ID=CAMNT_0053432951 /DNA_START=37 /DNA_END=587 /DNA_ORIENTATION=-
MAPPSDVLDVPIRGSEVLEAAHFNTHPMWREPLPGLEPRLSMLTALQYFQETTAGKPGFYDRDSDNERVLPPLQADLSRLAEREENLFRGDWNYATYAEVRKERDELVKNAMEGLTGIQFRLLDKLSREEGEHRLYVVEKIKRKSRKEEHGLALYTIYDGVIRRLPDLYALVESRLAKAAYHAS